MKLLTIGQNTPIFEQLKEMDSVEYLQRIQAQDSQVYDLYFQILEIDNKRFEFVKRFGKEANPIIDAFLEKALEFDESNILGFQSFVSWFENAEHELTHHANDDEVQVYDSPFCEGIASSSCDIGGRK